MSSQEQQLERLNQLLGRVQKNRRQRPVGLEPMAALGAASAATPANTTGQAAVGRPAAAPQPPLAAAAVGGPAASPSRPRKPTPAEPITAAVAAPPTPVREEPAPEAPMRRPARPISPLETAISGEAEREERALPQPAVRAPMPPMPPMPPSAPMNEIAARAGGTQPRSQRPPASPPEAAAQQPIVPRVIEPDPPRASTRPIAQVVSKHAPMVDATFGAMLKRSLSLRPH